MGPEDDTPAVERARAVAIRWTDEMRERNAEIAREDRDMGARRRRAEGKDPGDEWDLGGYSVREEDVAGAGSPRR